jgi:SAM-dependent methyltransferase/rubredoxin
LPPDIYNNQLMNRINQSKCPVCGSGELNEFMKNYDFSITREDFDLYKCASCGFILTQDAPDEATIGKYYKSDVYISHSDTNKGFVAKLYHIVRAIMLDKKAKAVELISEKRKGSLLDIGTGLGYFPNHMKSRGWQVEGIEQDEETRNKAMDNFGFQINPPAAVYEMKDRNFDVITMWHVLEHVHNLDGYLKSIRDNLSDDGTFVVALPNSDSPDAHYYGKFWAGWDVPRHLWHWNPENFEKFAVKHGFSLIVKKPMPMDGFYVSLLSAKYKGCKIPAVSGFWRGLITWFKSLNNTDLSSSVIYFLKKR